MSNTQAITIRLDAQKSEWLNLLAQEYDRSKNHLVNEALEQFLEQEVFHLQALTESLAQADNEEVVEHEQVKAEMIKLVTDQ